jgi:hypothetical protein
VGSLSIVNVNGTDQVQFTPTPGLNFTGTGTEATFTYTVSDTNGTTTTANASFRVEPVVLSGNVIDGVIKGLAYTTSSGIEGFTVSSDCKNVAMFSR